MTLYKRGKCTGRTSSSMASGTQNRRGPRTGDGPKQIDQGHKEELNLVRQGISEPHPEMTFGELAARFIAEALTETFSPRPTESPPAVLERDAHRAHHESAREGVPGVPARDEAEALRHDDQS